ncbi:DnaJ domain protein [Salmonella enterica subsp. enterica]|nr:DnaJ domain protein [Salmonella enterica subsp. enterica]
MNICWEILGIEPTTDLECIRQAYLALLPSFHPESDPQGFKRLRQAYEEAQHWGRLACGGRKNGRGGRRT